MATSMPYTHLSPGFLQEAINLGSLTGSGLPEDNQGGLNVATEIID